MTNPKLFATGQHPEDANIFLNQAQGYYDRTAARGARVTLLAGSILEKPDPDGWIFRDLETLANQGSLQRIGSQYKVVSPITGSTSGTAAAVLGAGFRPAGYEEWKFGTGLSIAEAGEK
ncbi:hypothetical protein DFQ01_101447 [Paenibacillus cellulosilyticus]|uniref:Uncharacterized protein n=1 Tax=Paenibacillus cellulosilyticus TaxID=375489 RepID=A0A2V2Z9D1_9BACL|nr:hypothetical protein [Paenibacillus cellulosilyticus]PWW08721.1 hypothetical protein DFQ01_101447 [Paenibacillus cellulosilyticus]QKS48285.1 hypothetical protein HUB94_28855 [Paenibacillus cellulosilyticus]